MRRNTGPPILIASFLAVIIFLIAPVSASAIEVGCGPVAQMPIGLVAIDVCGIDKLATKEEADILLNFTLATPLDQYLGMYLGHNMVTEVDPLDITPTLLSIGVELNASYPYQMEEQTTRSKVSALRSYN